MKNIFFSMLAVGSIAAAAPVAQAQGYNPFEIGASGGIAFPTSDLGRATNTGYNVAFMVGARSQYSPIAVRAEAAYNQFGLQGGGGNINIAAFTGNLEYTLPLGLGFTPYAIGGAGLYRPSADLGGGNTGTENHFGWNIGGGVQIPLSSSFRTFVEARYHNVSANGGNLTFIPITFGVMF